MATVIIFAVIVVGVIAGIRHQQKVNAAGCCGAGGDVEKKVKVKDKNKDDYPYTTELVCDDIHCKNCVTHVDNALNKMDGTWAEANEDTKKVIIRSKVKRDVSEYQNVLSDAGYPAHLA